MACKKWYMGTNTKMYKTIGETVDFISRLCSLTSDISRERFELFVIPSYTTLKDANNARNPELLKIGAQNMCWEERGQFTGEISPVMLSEVGCDIVMIGHSERRHVFLETDDMERRKVRSALDHGFTALLCIGETGDEKSTGKSDAVLEAQLRSDLADISPSESDRLIIAYEPVWAIGVNGQPVTIEYADDKLSFIRSVLKNMFGDAGYDIPVLYGGSVNNDNAVALSNCSDINGLFIGRSAWDADNFNEIIRKVGKGL